MKKHICFPAALLALCMAVSLTACQKTSPGAAAPPGEASPPPAVSPAPAVSYDDSLIVESLAEEGGAGEYAYCYHVPRLMGEGLELRSLNDELDAILGEMARQELESIKGGALPIWHTVRWESHWTGSLVSLVLQAESVEYGTSTVVLHYDFAGDRRLSSVEVLERMGVSGEKFLRAARRAAIKAFDAWARELPLTEETRERYYLSDGGEPSLLENRWATLAAVMVEDAPVYFADGAWQYALSLCLDGPGGEEWYSRTVKLDFEEPMVNKTVKDSRVTAALENGRVSLAFGDWPEAGLDPDAVYPVEGTWSDHTDLFLGRLDPEDRPVLFLRTDQGTLEYLDLGLGAWYGLFCPMPIPGDFTGAELENAVEEGQYGQYRSVYARWSDGRREDLGLWVGSGERTALREDWYGAPEEPASVSFCDDVMEFSVTGPDGSADSGFAQLQGLGMTEAGIVCGCTRSPYNGPGYAGAFAYRYGYAPGEGGGRKALVMDLLTGTSPFGEAGDQITFYSGHGEG